jgi:hypothetical protein
LVKRTFRRSRQERSEQPALQQTLAVDGHVEIGHAHAAAQPAHLAPHLARALRIPEETAPAAGVHRDHAVQVGMPAEDGRLAPLHDPGDLRQRVRAADRARERERVDDVAQRGELDDGDLHRAPPKRSTMTRMRSRAA